MCTLWISHSGGVIPKREKQQKKSVNSRCLDIFISCLFHLGVDGNLGSLCSFTWPLRTQIPI